MKKVVVGILIIAIAAGAWLKFLSPKDNVPMASHAKPMRTLTTEQLLSRVDNKNQPMRLRTATDVIPGGYSAAMAPLIIDWKASEIKGENAFVIIRNLNHGGNPVDGTTVLCSAKVPLNGVEAVEFVLLPLDKIGKQGLVQHGQLRFIFASDQPVVLLNYGEESMGSDRYIQDLVFSWEAWRAPDEGYNVKTGMNPSAYLLSPRVFSGPTRFLDDALGHRDWFSYRLRMPNGRLGFGELLRTNLALCDGVARHTISKILKQSEEQWLRNAPGNGEDFDLALAEWKALRKAAEPNAAITDTLLNLPEENQPYQTLLRSCATMALYTINVAVDRLAASGHTDGLNPDFRMLPELGQQEPWMTELADTDLKGIFMRAPSILKFLRDNPEAFPKRIPHQLEKAGLLNLTNGKPDKRHYELQGQTPYGTLQENLIK